VSARNQLKQPKDRKQGRAALPRCCCAEQRGYLSVTPPDAYITKSVKIESSAKSALDPNSVRMITPCVDGDVPAFEPTVAGVTAVDAERTFWGKVLIRHGMRRRHDIRGLPCGNDQRISKHY
jgi:hypothetical protein